MRQGKGIKGGGLDSRQGEVLRLFGKGKSEEGLPGCVVNWRQESQYHLRSGEYTVCKVTVSGKVIYEAWKGKTRLGDSDTAEGAKVLCQQ